jgi:hypothetical protein
VLWESIMQSRDHGRAIATARVGGIDGTRPQRNSMLYCFIDGCLLACSIDCCFIITILIISLQLLITHFAPRETVTVTRHACARALVITGEAAIVTRPALVIE